MSERKMIEEYIWKDVVFGITLEADLNDRSTSDVILENDNYTVK